MELYNLTDDVQVTGIQVKTFPYEIRAAFESLMRNLGPDRDFYGVSWMNEHNTVTYYAMASGNISDSEKKYGYESFTLDKGEYMTEVVNDWQSKTDSVSDIFHNLMGNTKPDKSHPCIEWYQSDQKMICLFKAK